MRVFSDRLPKIESTNDRDILRKGFKNSRKNEVDEAFKLVFGLRFVVINNIGRNPNQTASRGFAEQRLYGDEDLLFPIICGKGVPHLKPIKSRLLDISFSQ